jgi:hypothetical protein
MRSTHYGAPASLPAGQMSVAGSTTTAGGAIWVGGPNFAYAIDDIWQVEAGVELFMGGWGLLNTGMRVTPVNVGGRWVRFALDVEVGGGVGAGGNLHCDEDDEDFDPENPPYPACANPDEVVDWWRRPAAGWYAGLGVAVHFPYVAIFARGRAQGSYAYQVPDTYWWTAVGGIAGDILGYLDVYFAAGYAGFDADGYAPHGWILDMGLAANFDVGRRRGSSPR